MVSHSSQVRENLWVFSTDELSKENTSWWLGCEPEPILIDCPQATKENIDLLRKISRGKVFRIILTSREAHGDVRSIQEALDCNVLVQEQEAYLLPAFEGLESFSSEHRTISNVGVLWTPGPTPGSCVAYAPAPWNVLFCGRLLIPVAFNQISSLKHQNTFHWSRQLKSLKKLKDWLPQDAFPQLASGGSLKVLKNKNLLPWSSWKEEL